MTEWWDQCLELAQEDDWPGVARLARQWLTAEPDSALAHVALGEALSSMEQFAKAEEALRKAIDLAPRLVDAWVILGGVYHQQGRHGNVQEVHQSLLGIDPDVAARFQAHFIEPEINRYRKTKSFQGIPVVTKPVGH